MPTFKVLSVFSVALASFIDSFNLGARVSLMSKEKNHSLCACQDEGGRQWGGGSQEHLPKLPDRSRDRHRGSAKQVT